MQSKRRRPNRERPGWCSAVPLVLAILDGGETYGYAMLKRIDELSGAELRWTDRLLCPSHRLDPLGYLEAKWDPAQASMA